MNLHGFVGNNPLNEIDPYGLWYLLYAPSWFDGKGYQGSNWKAFSEAYIPFQHNWDQAMEAIWRGEPDLTRQAFVNLSGEAMLAALTAGIAERFPGYVNQVKGWLSKQCANGAGLVEQGSMAVLKNGYYEVNGLKFSEYYYNKLWSTGRGAPSLAANEILASGAKGVPDAVKAGFFRYEAGGWEMVFNPSTKEVWHLQPIK